jgi:hypothetical protein
MNRIKQHNQEVAAKGFTLFSEVMPKACEPLDLVFNVINIDTEEIRFEIDGYLFSLTWDIKKRNSIGKMRDVVVYQLSAWNSVGGGRWHPPEMVDTTLVNDQSIWVCMHKAFSTVSEGRITQVLDAVGEDLEYRDGKKLEEWY